MLVFVVTIVVTIVALFAAKQYRTAESYSRLARRYRGTYERGPKVSFMHDGSRVVVDICSTGGKDPTRYTQVHFYGLQPSVRCEVYPEGMWSRLGRLKGMEDIEIGSPHFDDQYVITGDDPVALRSLLTPAVQLQIEYLRRFLGNNSIYVSFNRRELLVKMLSFIRDYDRLLEFTKLAVELYDQAVLAAEKGIEFVQDTVPPEVTEALCQICGETIQADVVFCRRCKTPHHLDCWQYYRACSTYGCGEKRYLLPKPQRGKKPGKQHLRARGARGPKAAKS